MIMKNKKNKKVTDIFDRGYVKCIMTAYIIAISAFISYMTSKVYYELLWPNERTAVVLFMTISVLLPYAYMLFSGISGFKTFLIYHFILIGTALVMIVPFEFRPYILLVMIVSVLTNFSVGIVANAGMCGFGFFSMASEPEFFFTVITLLMGTLSCYATRKFVKSYYKYVACAVLVIFNMVLNGIFRVYCVEVYLEYEELSFIFKGSIGCIVAVLVYLVLDFVYGRFVLKKASLFTLKQMMKEDYKPLKYMKSKSITTYYHCKEVAELAKLCAKAVGADENVSYVGALYHDIGKLFGNEYVKEGIGFARKNNFPRDIIDIIANHNIKYGVVKNKECAIVFMVDTAINAYNYVTTKEGNTDVPAKKVFENAIMNRFVSGHLNSSTLSVEEFYKVMQTIVDSKEH